MILKTKYHGDIEYKENEVINFKRGILSFEQLTKFIVFPLKGNDFFNVVHSIEDKDIGFIVASPFSIKKDYTFELSDKTIEELEIKNSNEVLVQNILTINSDMIKTTINLRAPLIININSKLGEQIILNNENYSIKTPIIQEEK